MCRVGPEVLTLPPETRLGQLPVMSQMRGGLLSAPRSLEQQNFPPHKSRNPSQAWGGKEPALGPDPTAWGSGGQPGRPREYADPSFSLQLPSKCGEGSPICWEEQRSGEVWMKWADLDLRKDRECVP